jgi:hypothetical protein
MTYLKGYMKSIKAHLAEHNPERVPAFEKGAAVFAKKCVLPFPLSFQPILTLLLSVGFSPTSVTGSSSPASP